jgi:hypothetical protein
MTVESRIHDHNTHQTKLELGLIGSGIRRGFLTTDKLHAIKYTKAIAGPDCNKWQAAIHNEYIRMTDNEVFTVLKTSELPNGANVLTSTWALKKKANGQFQAQLTARGYKQIDGKHYNSHNIAAPIITDVTICTIITLMVMADWKGYLMDINRAFLKDKFKKHKLIYMKYLKALRITMRKILHCYFGKQSMGLNKLHVHFGVNLYSCSHTWGITEA